MPRIVRTTIAPRTKGQNVWADFVRDMPICEFGNPEQWHAAEFEEHEKNQVQSVVNEIKAQGFVAIQNVNPANPQVPNSPRVTHVYKVRPHAGAPSAIHQNGIVPGQSVAL